MFGEDVYAFRPERWLEGDKTNIGLPESFALSQGSLSYDSYDLFSVLIYFVVRSRFPFLHRQKHQHPGNV